MAQQVSRELDREVEQVADVPLALGGRIGCLLFCGLPALLVAAFNFSRGRTRCGSEALRWMEIGLVMWVLIGLLVQL